ncbi:MAG TPA: tetratricopeptide repeat protein [Candidatus Udaeobacter sp.]|jgi:tetratricopeptide (TPR) repeat protein|nr:tetratricopeptide repeat protein [Candidatus Udaeobacter sp.]
MKISRAFLLLILFVIANLCRADEPLNFQTASRPLEEGVPEVAVDRLQQLLRKNLSLPEKRQVMWKLAEALIAAHDGEGALKILGEAPLRDFPATNFWKGQAFASLYRWQEALIAYDRVVQTEKDPVLRANALFGKAEAQRALYEKDDALQTVMTLVDDPRWGLRARFRATELLLDKRDPTTAANILSKAQAQSALEKQERRFLRGRIEMELQHQDKAQALFETILKKSEPAHHSLVIAALFAISDVQLQLKTPEAADDVLEDFIEHHANDPELGRVFAKLDQVYQSERKPSRTELTRWSTDPAQPRRALAQWYLARAELRVGHRAAAMENFRAMVSTAPKQGDLLDGFLEFAQLQKDDRRFDDAIGVLEAARSLRPNANQLAKIGWLIAEVQYEAKRFDISAREFEKVAQMKSGPTNEALFNASLGWLQIDNDARFQADYKTLGAGEEGGDASDLLLEQGIVQAAQNDPKASDSLGKFLRDFPKNKRVSEAWVALAELAFHASPPRLEEAQENLKRAMDAQPTDVARERADYLKIWIEDASSKSDEKQIVSLANQFLRDHPSSPFIPDVRMKLAEAYYRGQDFANAQTQFELLAAKQPEGPFAEKALFFAGESALASMGSNSLERALTLFDNVVHKEGELKWAARNEQAVIERKLGKPQDALALYDEVLKGNAKQGEKREALCGKGDVYFEMGTSAPENFKRAIESYDQLIADNDAPPHWKNQAQFKKGVCLEKSGDAAGSLAIFYRVLESETQPNRPREFFWYYKAGFNAARLLEEQSKWDSAAAIYQKLAAAEGTRSDEAKARLAQLRLQHFLWEQ